MLVTDQSSKKHPSILPLATLGGETATGGAFAFPSQALSIFLFLQSTLTKTSCHSEILKLSLRLTLSNSGGISTGLLLVCLEHLSKKDSLSSNPFPGKVEQDDLVAIPG